MSSGEMKAWNVRVYRKGVCTPLGQVHEASETLARCAALSKYAAGPDDDDDEVGIGPNDDFEVTPA